MNLKNRLQSEYDLLIAGSGAAAVCAAMVAREQGKTAAILEKQAQVGGSTGYSGGVLWVPNNPLLAEHGVRDCYERGRRYLDAVVPDEGPATSALRREAYLKAGPQVIEFLQDKGMAFYYADGWPDYYDDRPGGEPRGRSLMADPFNANELGEWRDRLSMYPPFTRLPIKADEAADLLMASRTWRGKFAALRFALNFLAAKLRGHRRVVNGAALQGRLLKLALDRDIPIFPQTAVTGLVEEDGRVTGVHAHHGNADRVIKAREGVLLNAGGFARNTSMRETHQRLPLAHTNAHPGDTGEVLEAAMQLGAATAAMDAGVWVLTSRCTDGTWPKDAVGEDGAVYPSMHVHDIAAPFSIIVDQAGQRYFNECESYMAQGESLYRRQEETGRAVPSWLIMDARNRKRYGLGLNPPGFIKRDWLESGYLKRADSIDELALNCGIDTDGLKQTVKRFNGYCRTGKDEDFDRGGRQYDRWRGDPTVKPNPNLGPIEKAPFYALAIYPGDVGTYGGVLTDEYSRVLREDGSIIGGLYAAGNCTASVTGHTYPAAGASIAASMVFGYIAAHHAVGATHLLPRLTGE